MVFPVQQLFTIQPDIVNMKIFVINPVIRAYQYDFQRKFSPVLRFKGYLHFNSVMGWKVYLNPAGWTDLNRPGDANLQV
jgi:hypothetical protein